MDPITMEGVILTPLKQIIHPKGDIYHGMKVSDPGYHGFGEAYFSTIYCGDIKPWKKHLRTTLNFMVPVGKIRFVLYDDRLESSTRNLFFDRVLGVDNYQRITIPAGIWVAFAGIGTSLNLLLNIANLEHDPMEIERKENLHDIHYDW